MILDIVNQAIQLLYDLLCFLYINLEVYVFLDLLALPIYLGLMYFFIKKGFVIFKIANQSLNCPSVRRSLYFSPPILFPKFDIVYNVYCSGVQRVFPGGCTKHS